MPSHGQLIAVFDFQGLGMLADSKTLLHQAFRIPNAFELGREPLDSQALFSVVR